ncbi:hypothetical protein FB471_5391 [Amycolatopsis cihanbeyliensis]|uniref:Uncharacterized protein n=1 Tax=Amycolatopsis cihanbeyliensis TaxID=1128664 RepID=A0A542DRC8_AMYCI|nr:hypothetical protein FB471_5391 [Amycolatopsis cihanbeyliensis]
MGGVRQRLRSHDPPRTGPGALGLWFSPRAGTVLRHYFAVSVTSAVLSPPAEFMLIRKVENPQSSDHSERV